MTDKAEAQKEIRTILARLYSRMSDAVRVAEDAGLDLTLIEFDNKLINYWHNILSEADKRNKIEDVVSIALDEYQENEQLKSAYQAYLDSVESFHKNTPRKSRIQISGTPRLDLEAFESVLFQEYQRSARIRSGRFLDAMTIHSVFDEWEWDDSARPLFLVCDFAPDVRPTLFALTDEVDRHYWIRGDILFGLNSQESGQNTSSFVDLKEEDSSVLLIDFSEIRPEVALGDPPQLKSPSLTESVAAFCRLAISYGHQVVIGMPRFIGALLDIDQLNDGSTLIFTSAELFSSDYEYRVERCQALLSEKLSIGIMGRVLRRDRLDSDFLSLLLMANSYMLPIRVAEFLGNMEENVSLDLSPTNPAQLPVLLELANFLTNHGFYEIAYRLETYCRTVGHLQELNLISLDADIDLEPQRRNYSETITGLVNGLENMPVVISRGLLTGDPGSGKTTGLLQIEQFWSLPQTNLEGVVHPHWLPLFITMMPGLDLAGQIKNDFRLNIEFDDRQTLYQLACHALLFRVGSPSNLRWLFRSPIYFLFDGVDEVSIEQQPVFEQELRALLDVLPDAGYLLALRGQELIHFTNVPKAQIRPMNNQQFQTFILNKKIGRSWSNLLGMNDNPVGRYLRNPYVLDLIGRSLTSRRTNIEEINLFTIFQAYINEVTQPLSQPVAYRLTEEWLPELALRIKIEGQSTIRLEDERFSELQTIAKQLKLLRRQDDDRTIRFQQQLLLDYFAAKKLAQEISTHGMEATLSRFLPQSQILRFWRVVLRFLSNLLDLDQIVDLTNYICEQGEPRLAIECLLELPIKQTRQINNEIAQRLVGRIESQESRDIFERVRDAEALSYLDPRIYPDDPSTGMIEIHPSEPGLPEFKVNRYPVTNLEFAKFVDAGGYDNPDLWFKDSWHWLRDQKIRYPRYWQHHGLNKPNYPVVGVSFYEAVAYCRWLSSQHPEITFSLPSVAQWDIAAHGHDSEFDQLLKVLRQISQNEEELNLLLWQLDDERVYPYYEENRNRTISNNIISYAQAYMTRYQPQLEHGAVTPVGILPANDQGCHDLFGNVWEWTCTWLSSSEPDDTDIVEKPIKPGDLMIVKGGSWAGTYNPIWNVMDGWLDPYVRFHELGFRLCQIE